MPHVVHQIVMGVRLRRDWNHSKDREDDAYQFCSAGASGHQIFGKVVKDEGGVVELEDLANPGHDDSVLLWVFEPLTLQRWHEMSAEISLYSVLKDQFASDDDLCRFYREQYMDGWEEKGD